MRRGFRVVSVAVSALAIVGAIGFSSAVIAGNKMSGKDLAFNKKKGNCLACHLIAGGDQAGNIAPPLVAMKARFPKKSVLRAQIAEPRTKNPDTVMPPFAAHGILSDKEIDAVTDFIYGL